MDSDSSYSGEIIEPTSPATQVAWEVRSQMLLFANSEPGSVQAESAKAKANEAFEEFVLLTEPEVSDMLFARIIGGEQDVVDVLQETYKRAYRGLKTFRGDCPAEGWLMKIAANRAKTHNEKRAKELKKLSKSSPSDTSAVEFDELNMLPSSNLLGDPSWFLEQEVLRKELIKALEDLSPRHRISVVLHHAYGVAHSEIAEKLGVTENNAKQLVFRAIKKLRKNTALQNGVDEGE